MKKTIKILALITIGVAIGRAVEILRRLTIVLFLHHSLGK